MLKGAFLAEVHLMTAYYAGLVTYFQEVYPGRQVIYRALVAVALGSGLQEQAAVQAAQAYFFEGAALQFAIDDQLPTPLEVKQLALCGFLQAYSRKGIGGEGEVEAITNGAGLVYGEAVIPVFEIGNHSLCTVYERKLMPGPVIQGIERDGIAAFLAGV